MLEEGGGVVVGVTDVAGVSGGVAAAVVGVAGDSPTSRCRQAGARDAVVVGVLRTVVSPAAGVAEVDERPVVAEGVTGAASVESRLELRPCSSGQSLKPVTPVGRGARVPDNGETHC